MKFYVKLKNIFIRQKFLNFYFIMSFNLNLILCAWIMLKTLPWNHVNFILTWPYYTIIARSKGLITRKNSVPFPFIFQNISMIFSNIFIQIYMAFSYISYIPQNFLECPAPPLDMTHFLKFFKIFQNIS